MGSNTRKIAPTEWEHHKDTIVELYLTCNKPLKDVRAEMQDQHGFDASSWQYEMQLKRWNIRKNATRREWQHYFAANKDQPIANSRGDGPRTNIAPVILSKSTESKKRASRWASGSIVTPNSVAAHAVLAPQVSGSTSPGYEGHLNRVLSLNGPMVAQENTEPGFQHASQNTMHSLHATESFPLLNEPCWIDNFSTHSMLGSHSQTFADVLRTPAHSLDFDLTLSEVTRLQSPVYGVGNSDLADFSVMGLPAGNNTAIYVLQDIRQKLPFAQLEQIIMSRGIVLVRSVGHTIFGGFAPRVVAGFLSSKDQSIVQQASNFKRSLSMLGAQIPGENLALITDDQAFETKFARVLLFSMLNGFAGLYDVPMKNILRFLNQLGVNKLLLDILEQSPRYVSTTLADNIFRAAIEASDTKVVTLLLDRRLVDVNETVCFHDTERYTPIEQAAVLRSLKLMRLLIASGADVNKSHAGCNMGGALNALTKDIAEQRLFINADDRPAIPAESMEALNMLVSAGARLHPGTMLLDSDPQAVEFNFLILQNAPPQNYRELFDPASGSCLLNKALKYFDDHHATRWIRNLINLCQQAGCNKCLVDFGGALKETVIEAAFSGKLGLVQLILHEAAVKPNLAPVFLAAIESQKPALIDFILSLGPDLDPPAFKFNLDPARPRSADFLRTPIAEAVRHGNQHLIRILEAGGCLDHLTEGDRFEAVIDAAAETGNAAYMRKLLARAMTSKQAYRATKQALALALSGSHQDIAQMLLEAGAISSHESHWHEELSPGTPISIDMLMVHALIAAGAGVVMCKQLAEMDRSIAAVVFNEYPGHPILDDDLPDFLDKCIKTDALDFFREIVEKRNLKVGELDHCLALAVKLGHGDLVRYLLDMGANPLVGSVLRNAIRNQPDMLHLLLQKERRRQTIPKCIGACVLEPIMGNSAGNAEALDELIGTNAINFERLERVYDFERDSSQRHFLLATISPLGMAIQGLPRKLEANMVAMKQFLEAGADPNGISKLSDTWHHDSPLMTALMVAIETGREDAVNMLLDYGADVNARPRIRTTRTALQLAAELGNMDMVRLLLSRGADANSSASSRGGATALQFAAISGNCNMVAELLDHGAQLDALPSRIDGMWALEGAAAKGRLDMIRFLWELKVREEAKWEFPKGFSERQCLRAMNFARENGHIGCRDLISELSGISVDRLETDEYGASWIAY